MQVRIIAAVIAALAALCLISSAQAQIDGLGPDFTKMAIGPTDPWPIPLMPVFESAAADYQVPLPLLLALGYFGSAFENRGGAPTIEYGYGVMALRENKLGGDSLATGASLTGATTEQLKLDPVANIRAAAAVLDYTARSMKINRSAGLQTWLEPVIKYAGLDEENSRFFAMEVFEKLQSGLNVTNAAGETFQFEPQDIGTIDLGALEPPGRAIVGSTDYGPAIWDPAASCNYSTSWTNKDTVIVHTIEGSAAGARSWFKNCNSNVSAHYVISEAGGVWQCVREGYVAWHAGCYNSRAIGLEHEGYAASSSHPQSLYDASALLTRDICESWGIPKEKRTVGPGVLGHIDVTRCCCGTHTDPGNGWDWNYYMNQVRGTPPPPTWAASYHAQSYPSSMTAGETAIAWVEYRNDGTGTWTHGNTYLGTSSPQDRASPFYNSGNWAGPNRPTDVDQSSVTQGQIGRFTFILKAPSTPGTYVEKYRLVQEGVTWFGGEITWTITVTPATGSITGTVRSAASGQGISGATVTISGGPSTTTNSSGGYTFSSVNVGTYTLTATASGYNPASSPVTVNSGAATTQDFSLTPTDTQAPTAPSGLTATAVSPSQINLSWTASTDNVGVTGYKVYRGGAEIGVVTGTTYQDNGLAANTTYSYYVKARDAAGNLSAASNTANATTFPGQVPIFEDGFANTDYWEAIVQSPMPGPYPAVLSSEKNHGTFAGPYCLKTQTSTDPNQGCLIGHRFEPSFGAARFETFFYDGAGMGYGSEFEGSIDGWASYPSAYATLSSVGGGHSGSCLQASDGGWTSGCYKEITGGFTAGESYSLSMWSKWPAPPAGKTYSTPPRCFVRFLDGAGTEIRTDYSVDITTDNAWRQYGVSGTVPAGTAKIWVGHWGVLGATQTYTYFADSVVFSSGTGVPVNNNSRQGLQVRCVDDNGGVKAIYYLGTYAAAPGSQSTYSAGYYKVCGTGCTGWYWPGAACAPRTSGWHKLAIDFQPYTGAGNEVRFYIDGTQVATAERTLDTHLYGLNMVAYGFHYRVNVESWFDDCAMYATQPHPAPTIGTPQALGTDAIRWSFTDNSNNEAGFKVLDAANQVRATTGPLIGTGGAGYVDEVGLAPNTPCVRTIRAYNGTLDSFSSASATRWTLSAPPTPSNVTCSRPAGTWHATPRFEFSAVGGFGEGTVAGYRYAWNQSPSYAFTGAEPVWSTGDLLLNAASEGAWYLHVQGINGEGVANGSLDLGPYRYDADSPQNPASAQETHGAPNGAWQCSVGDPAFTWTDGSDGSSGIVGYLVYFGPDEQGTSSTTVALAAYDPDPVGTGVYHLRVRAKDAAGNEADEWATLFTLKYDSTAPDTPVVTDDGPFTGSRNKLHASWQSSDADSGIAEYSYAVGTTPGGSEVLGWTSAGAETEALITLPDPGLTAGPTYYISVKARNAAGGWSDVGSSDGVRVAGPTGSIAAAKALGNDEPIGLQSKVVTASYPGSFYIEDIDRTSGILVMGPGADPGALVTVGGIMGTNAAGERAIISPAVITEAAADPARIPKPLFVTGAWLGGSAFNAFTAGADSGVGLNNVGLLVRVSGRVTAVSEREMLISDGASASPIKVVSAGAEFVGFAVGDYVTVTGISSLELTETERRPMVRLAGPDGVRKVE